MSTYLITGASRGIGLELTRQLLALPPTTVRLVFALSRSGPNPALSSLLTEHRDRLIHITASVTDTASVRAAASEVVAHLEKQGKGLDVLVNNAGTQNWNEGGIAKLDEADLLSVFDLNVVGVQRVTAAFMPLLEKGGEKKVINISSTVGSIDWAPKFAAAKVESYKVSKAALNMLNQQWAMQYADAGFTFLLVSPGWLRTDLGGPHADLDVETGVTDVKRIILEADKSMNGKFVNIHVPGMEDSYGRYDGKEIAW